MIFKLHYWFLTAGACAPGILLGVFIEHYTDARSIEIGALFMLMPFLGLIFRPLVCSFADRYQAHQKYMLWCLFMVVLSYSPFVIIPFMGESFYGKHPRLCWYLLVAFRIIGDIAFGGVVSIGDSLAINYSHRIGTNFGVYRIWGTISWIVFGLIIGQINEIWFLPKFVPAFLVLIICSLLNMSLFWLWPKEYFVMVTKCDERKGSCFEKSLEDGKKQKKCNPITKSLLPKEVVLAHIKAKLCSLIPCYSCFKQSEATSDNKIDLGEKANKQKVATIVFDTTTVDQQKTTSQNGIEENEEEGQKSRGIGKMAQAKILLLLVRRDIRLILYFLVFVLAGFNIMTLNFFFISLSELCTAERGCSYSSLAGLLQASMASSETVLFIYIKEVEQFFGRVNMAGISFLLMSFKFMFYGTIWTSVSPYYSLVSESLHGLIFGILLTLQVETAHMFANEVEYIIPELIEKKVVTEEDDVEKLKLSLSATMQAVMTSACDGFGRGFGALIYGIVIDKYSFETLWLSIGICASIACIITFLISVVDNTLHLNLGLDKKARQKMDQITME